jgi:hypothetical protein
MTYLLIAVAVLLLAAAAAFLLRSATGNPARVPTDDQLDGDLLKATLRETGVEVDATQTPDTAILLEYIAADDDFIDAVQAKRGSKHAILVLLDDRLVIGESTLGRMGAEVHVIPLESVTDFDQTYDIGGVYTIECADRSFKYTHVPRSRTRDFAGKLRERLP